MGKDPAVLFYTSDFLSGTFTMTDDQVGKYIRLLCLQHQKGKLTEKDMLHICKTYDFDIWNKFIKDEEHFYNKKMLDETERRQKYSESRKNNRNSAKNDTYVNTYVKHMETETETITETKNRTKAKTEIKILDEQFEQFWNLYDYKKSREKAEKVWRTLTNEEKVQAIYHAPLYAQSTPDKTFRKHPTTYLNQKSFNDEIIERTNATSHKPNASERRFNALASLYYVQNGGEDI